MTSLLCQSSFSYRLPIHIWIDIFSFWQRKLFYIETDDDDMSDSDLTEDEDEEDDEIDEEDEDQEMDE